MKLKEYILSIVVTLLAIIALLIHLFVLKQRDIGRIIQCFLIVPISLIVPMLNKIFKLQIPLYLNVTVCVFAFISLNLGGTLDFYHFIPYYDKFLHTAFGLGASYLILILFTFLNHGKITNWPFAFIINLLVVLGLAAVWEVYEFYSEVFIGGDPQRWKPILEEVGEMTVKDFFLTYNPLVDTMLDIVVALIGNLIFFLVILIDAKTKRKIISAIENLVILIKGKRLPE